MDDRWWSQRLCAVGARGNVRVYERTDFRWEPMIDGIANRKWLQQTALTYSSLSKLRFQPEDNDYGCLCCMHAWSNPSACFLFVDFCDGVMDCLCPWTNVGIDMSAGQMAGFQGKKPDYVYNVPILQNGASVELGAATARLPQQLVEYWRVSETDDWGTLLKSIYVQITTAVRKTT